MESNRSFLWSLIFGGAFFCTGLGTFAIFGTVAHLTCVRPEPAQVSCSRRVTLLGVELREETLPRVGRAVTEESCDSDGCTYRVVLTGDRGRFPLTSYYSSGRQEKERIAGEINSFLNNRELNSFETTAGLGWWVWLFPIVFGGIGLAAAGRPLWAILRGDWG